MNINIQHWYHVLVVDTRCGNKCITRMVWFTHGLCTWTVDENATMIRLLAWEVVGQHSPFPSDLLMVTRHFHLKLWFDRYRKRHAGGSWSYEHHSACIGCHTTKGLRALLNQESSCWLFVTSKWSHDVTLTTKKLIYGNPRGYCNIIHGDKKEACKECVIWKTMFQYIYQYHNMRA